MYPRKQPQRRHVPMPSYSFNSATYWENILREFVFKTISPPPPGNNQLYKRLLEAPFYGGPFPIVSNDAASAILSRGDVYYLPYGRWMFCQHGCSDCEPCTRQTQPTVKWVLRSVKRVSYHGSTRHDLQLTIVPQIDGSFHMRNLWPQSYVYVTSQGELDAYLNDRHSYYNDVNAYANVQSDFSGERRKPGGFWRYVDRNSLPAKRVTGESSKDTRGDPRTNVESTTAVSWKEQGQWRNETKNVRGQGLPGKTTEEQGTNDSPMDVRTKENGNGRAKENGNGRVQENGNGRVKENGNGRARENGNGKAKPLIPRLILGTDQLGQKHLVHVVPADTMPNASLLNSAMSNVLSSAGQNRTAYQRILRKIFDSLNNNRRSIENFLEPLTPTEKIGPYSEEHQQQETRSGFSGFRQPGRFYPGHKGWPYSLNWTKQSKTLNNNTFVHRFINDTSRLKSKLNSSNILNPPVKNVARNENVSDRINSKLIEGDYYINNTIDSNLKSASPTRNSQQHSPHKYKILVTTEATTKTDRIVDSRNSQNRSYLTSADRNILLNDKNLAYGSLRNSTQ